MLHPLPSQRFDLPAPENRPHALQPVARKRWDDAVAAELAIPGVVEWTPIGINGALRDFRCVAASPRGAALLGSVDGDVIGCRLTEIVGAWRGALELIRVYREAYASGRELTFLGEVPRHDEPCRVLHRVVSNPTGVTVTLTCHD